jgi:hypothetical protein
MRAPEHRAHLPVLVDARAQPRFPVQRFAPIAQG